MSNSKVEGTEEKQGGGHHSVAGKCSEINLMNTYE